MVQLMRIKTFKNLIDGLDDNAHILVKVLGRAMHLNNGIGVECGRVGEETHPKRLKLPYIITDLSNEFSFREDIERSRY